MVFIDLYMIFPYVDETSESWLLSELSYHWCYYLKFYKIENGFELSYLGDVVNQIWADLANASWQKTRDRMCRITRNIFKQLPPCTIRVIPY